MNLNDCLRHLIYEFRSESELLQSCEEISQKFTTQREDISDYLRDPKLVSAYTAFYLMTNRPKFAKVLEWMPKVWLEDLRESQLIDLGAGPGTFSFAFREWLGQPTSIVQIETSELMRQQGRKLWDGFYPSQELKQASSWKSALGEEKKRFLLFGHSANEMGAQVALKYIQDISPDHILFIEPGTKPFFQDMLVIRKALIDRGYDLLYPCPHVLDCPMDGTKDWCHQFIQVQHAPEVERLSQILKKDRKLLPLTVQAFSRTKVVGDREERIVRILPETKFSFEWEVCHKDSLDHYQLLKRDFDKKTLKELSSVLAGSHIEVSVEKVMEQGKRVKLKKLNNRVFDT